MTSFWRIFWLELVALVRSRTVAMLTVFSVAWTLAFPYLLRGDGTAAGAREIDIHYSLGGVFALLVVSILASSAGSIALERSSRRLALTLVRPVSPFAVAFGRVLAYAAAGAAVLAVACAVLCVRLGVDVRCSHVLEPVLPSPHDEAQLMYDAYMKDPETPEAVKKAGKASVVRLLAQRAFDRYEAVPTNASAGWRFDLASLPAPPESLTVRLRFAGQLSMRQDVVGTFRLGTMTGSVSNITQAVLAVPLGGGTATGAVERLAFDNRGRATVMLRPRRDLALLAPADTFGLNLFRAFLALVAVLALVAACGVFLSSALGRPVALFVAFVALVVGEMSPSVVEQYPDELGASVGDRIGLAIARAAAQVTRPVSSLAPLEALAKDECIEPAKVLRLVAVDFALLPVLLSLLAAFVLPRKSDDAGA